VNRQFSDEPAGSEVIPRAACFRVSACAPATVGLPCPPAACLLPLTRLDVRRGVLFFFFCRVRLLVCYVVYIFFERNILCIYVARTLDGGWLAGHTFACYVYAAVVDFCWYFLLRIFTIFPYKFQTRQTIIQYIYFSYLNEPFIMVHSISAFEVVLQW
jgi:hypothetical protein